MLAAELYHKSSLYPFDPALSEIYSSTVSLHHAKEGYDYPTIRLPHAFSKLAGLPTRIYQTLHEGALAFLVVVSPQTNPSTQLENANTCSKSSAFTRHVAMMHDHFSLGHRFKNSSSQRDSLRQ